jgi:hypothetical protein
MLINVLESIFNEFDFIKKVLNRNDYEVSLFYKETSSDYFIVLDKNSIESLEIETFLNVLQEVYVEFKRQEYTNETFDKNTTLILCVNGEVDNENLSLLEEDAYLFKKNIIAYTNNSLEELNHMLNFQYSYNNLLQNLNDEEKFEQYKSNGNIGYKLLVQIFIKLSFLKFRREMRNLDNLSEIILNRANEEGIAEIYNLINSENFNSQNINSYEDLI